MDVGVTGVFILRLGEDNIKHLDDRNTFGEPIQLHDG